MLVISTSFLCPLQSLPKTFCLCRGKGDQPFWAAVCQCRHYFFPIWMHILTNETKYEIHPGPVLQHWMGPFPRTLKSGNQILSGCIYLRKKETEWGFFSSAKCLQDPSANWVGFCYFFLPFFIVCPSQSSPLKGKIIKSIVYFLEKCWSSCTTLS